MDNALESYYHHFFDSGSRWFFDKSTNELVLYLKKYNIDEEDLNVDFEESFRNAETYYDVLGIPMNASSEEIKKLVESLFHSITRIPIKIIRITTQKLFFMYMMLMKL